MCKCGALIGVVEHKVSRKGGREKVDVNLTRSCI